MCGRYVIDPGMDIEIRKITEDISRRYGDGAIKTGEVFPTNMAAILAVNDEARLAPRPARWGFPHFRGTGNIINARSEGALDKAMFRKPLLTRRCVIPTTGFYEWQQIEGQKKKDKYLFNQPMSSAVYLAGMTNLFREGDGEFEAFVILTADANSSMKPYHHRMPVILNPNEIDDWISSEGFMEAVEAD